MSRQIAMGQPVRIQRRRTRGWRAPEGAVYVGRGTRWGNPTRVVYNPVAGGWHAVHDGGAGIGTWPTAAEARRFAAATYEYHLRQHPDLASAARRELAGLDLMCWCPLPEPGQPDHCHAAVLLRIANGGDAS